MNTYEIKRKITYFLAKHFGIAEYNGVYLKATNKYVYMTEYEDDNIINYENVGGTQLFPFDKNFLKYNEVFFGYCSLYRQYVSRHIKG